MTQLAMMTSTVRVTDADSAPPLGDRLIGLIGGSCAPSIRDHVMSHKET